MPCSIEKLGANIQIVFMLLQIVFYIFLATVL